MDRIKKLRDAALSATFSLGQFHFNFFTHYFENSTLPTAIRYAQALSHSFSLISPDISEGELIVGKISLPLSDEQKSIWAEKLDKPANEVWTKTSLGQNSHMAIDYELVLNKGLNGVIADIDNYILSCDEDKKDFYNSCKICLEAVCDFSERYAIAAEALAANASPERQKELLEISRICRKVPTNPAESFYEAVQSVHFITLALSISPFFPCAMQFQLGHPDRYLLPYYLKDIESGKITKEYAQLILDLLGIQINMRVPSGLSSGYMVGGRDKSGRVVANDLTLMCMQVVDDIRLVYPAVGLCYTDEMPDIYLEKACEVLSHGCSHPAIFGDDIISAGLREYGVSDEESHEYIHSTCVEITPVASSHAWVASPYINLAQMLLDLLDREYENFGQLKTAFLSKLSQEIAHQAQVYTDCRKIRSENAVNPLLSCFVNDCLALGKDIEQGGARYNWIMPSFVGMGNLVDSLNVIKEVIFDKKEMTIRELKAILDLNFEGQESFRQRILNKIPKYGNDIDSADLLYGEITSCISAECRKHKSIHSNGLFIPSVFCWVMHERFGSSTGATPDGRSAGFPLGDGSGPCQGREMCGPTASILSSTKWSHKEFIGGVAVNMKFGKKHFTERFLSNIISLIKTYINRGGFELQINVLDRETLEKAQQNPENYRDLIVRIGGYSDYFVKLSPGMQAEVILRTEHNL